MPGLKLIRASGETRTRLCSSVEYSADSAPFPLDVMMMDGRIEYVDETITIHEGDIAFYLIDGTTHDTIKWKKK